MYSRYITNRLCLGMPTNSSWKAMSLVFVSYFYLILFTFNYYVLMFVHASMIHKYHKHLCTFYLGHLTCLYILVLYLQIYYGMKSGKLSHKVRGTNKIIEEDLNNVFNQFFTDDILREREEIMKTCDKCGVYKPPRTHHCKVCDICYLKMDHHSYILNACIGHTNYKLYYLFMLANFMYSTFQLILLTYFAAKIQQTLARMAFYMLAIISNGIILIIALIFLVLHTRLLLFNETTIERLAIDELLVGDDSYKKIFQEGLLSTDENMDVRDRKLLNPYFLGYMENVKEVFGDNYCEWIMPYFTGRSNGTYFKKH